MLNSLPFKIQKGIMCDQCWGKGQLEEIRGSLIKYAYRHSNKTLMLRYLWNREHHILGIKKRGPVPI